jgi:EcsC protein family
MFMSEDDWVKYLTPKEISALNETNKWLHKDASRFKKVMGFTRKPIEYLYKKVPESVRESIASAILKVLTSVRDGTSNFVSSDAVLQKIEAKHGRLTEPHDIFKVGVLELDDIAQDLIKKSKNACTAEGAATGIAGLPGIVVDIPALYGLLFRMISQVSVCYGFDVAPEQERTHMLKILDIGHELAPENKKAGMAELSRLQQMIREAQPVAEVQRFAIQKGLQTMARHLGLALTQRKLAQSVVLVGGAIGAGVNRQLAGEVGEVAFHAFRRRHLEELAHLRRSGTLSGGSEPKAPKPRGARLPSPPSYSD